MGVGGGEGSYCALVERGERNERAATVDTDVVIVFVPV